MLDLTREDVDRGLNRLIKDGSIFQDGEFYRYDLSRR